MVAAKGREIRDWADALSVANEEAVALARMKAAASDGGGVHARADSVYVAPGLVPRLVFAALMYFALMMLVVGAVGWCVKWCIGRWSWAFS